MRLATRFWVACVIVSQKITCSCPVHHFLWWLLMIDGLSMDNHDNPDDYTMIILWLYHVLPLYVPLFFGGGGGVSAMTNFKAFSSSPHPAQVGPEYAWCVPDSQWCFWQHGPGDDTREMWICLYMPGAWWKRWDEIWWNLMIMMKFDDNNNHH